MIATACLEGVDQRRGDGEAGHAPETDQHLAREPRDPWPLDNYLGRITKGRIVEAVREAKGDMAADHIRPLKKAEMAKAAEELLTGSGWLPEPLRTPSQIFTPGIDPISLPDAGGEAQSAHNGDEPAMDQSCAGDDASEPSAAATAVAAE